MTATIVAAEDVRGILYLLASIFSWNAVVTAHEQDHGSIVS